MKQCHYKCEDQQELLKSCIWKVPIYGFFTIIQVLYVSSALLLTSDSVPLAEIRIDSLTKRKKRT